MLKKRIVACLTVKDGIVVQSINFRRYLPVGSVVISAQALDSWGIDEIVILDILASRQKRTVDFDLVTRVSKKIFVPLTVGGGIGGVDQMRRLVHCGADKVVLNTAAFKNPNLIAKAANIFGSQCIVVSVDVKKKQRDYGVFITGGTVATGRDPISFAKQAESQGAGEIFLTSVERNGSKRGYDIELVRRVADAVTIPVVACGGAGKPQHFLTGLVNGKASAVAAGNFFHFIEHSPIVVKSYLKQHEVHVRLDTAASYIWTDFRYDEKITKRSEDDLHQMRFEYLPKEVI